MPSELSSNDRDYRILNYLTGGMTPNERYEFEAELEKDASLRNALSFEKKLMQWGKSAGEKITGHYSSQAAPIDSEIEAMIKKAREKSEKEYPIVPDRPAPSRPLKRISRWVVAAALAGIVLVSALYFFNTKNRVQVAGKQATAGTAKKDSIQQKTKAEQRIAKENKPPEKTVKDKTGEGIATKRDKLFKANFTPDAVPLEVPDLLQEPMIYYGAAQYNDAISAFAKVDQHDLTRGAHTDKKLALFYTRYYTSLSYLAAGNALKAVSGFEHAIAQNPDQPLAVKAKWYLALAHLKIGHLKMSEKYLGELADDEQAGEYRTSAIKLKAEIMQ